MDSPGEWAFTTLQRFPSSQDVQTLGLALNNVVFGNDGVPYGAMFAQGEAFGAIRHGLGSDIELGGRLGAQADDDPFTVLPRETGSPLAWRAGAAGSASGRGSPQATESRR